MSNDEIENYLTSILNKKQIKMLARIIIAAVLLLGWHFVPITGIRRFICYLAVYLVIGYDIVKKAFKGIKNGQVFDENFLMAIATIGAFALAAILYPIVYVIPWGRKKQ